jgi:hydroxyacylglutathione hydrolase
MSIPLEDFFNDVVGKAMRGLGMTADSLAAASGVEVSAIQAVREGRVEPAVLLRIASLLNLHGTSLLAMAQGDWTPEPLHLEGLAQANTTYHDMTVNAYVVWDPTTREAAVFDTGATAAPLLEVLKAQGLTLRYLFLTHTHPDHVADMDALRAPVVMASEKEPYIGAKTFAPGTVWPLGGLTIEARSTWGHSQGGTTYVVRGLERPVAVVGDALFASSMGGGIVSYPDALATNRKEIFTLPDETIIAPGHGPLTTVSWEKQHNPFYPEFKNESA